MGNNCSPILKNNYMTQNYTNLIAEESSERKNTKYIKVPVGGGQSSLCMIKILEASRYPESLDNFEDFMAKITKQTPYICDFYFITNMKENSSNYELAFEFGEQRTNYHNIISDFTPAFYAMLSGLEFLESINLFYPNLSLNNLLFCYNPSDKHIPQTFKLVNHFGFDHFFDFIVKVYLNPNVGPAQTNKLVNKEKIQNLIQLKMILSKIIGMNPRLFDPSHQLSNILIFEKYLNHLDSENFTFANICFKFKEIFDINKNKNKYFNNQIDSSNTFYSGHKLNNSTIENYTMSKI